MSLYGIELDMVCRWAGKRAAELREDWAEAVHKLVKGSPWSCEVEVLLEDAADKQARAERRAHMRGETFPNAELALTELLAEIKQPARWDGSLPELRASKEPADLPF